MGMIMTHDCCLMSLVFGNTTRDAILVHKVCMISVHQKQLVIDTDSKLSGCTWFMPKSSSDNHKGLQLLELA